MKLADDADEWEKLTMTKAINGKIHGKTIELDEDLGVADGQEVQVQVTIVPPARKWGEGILRSAGGWVDYPEMDAIMEKIHQGREGDMS
jgi:hypothetical protein